MNDIPDSQMVTGELPLIITEVTLKVKIPTEWKPRRATGGQLQQTWL